MWWRVIKIYVSSNTYRGFLQFENLVNIEKNWINIMKVAFSFFRQESIYEWLTIKSNCFNENTRNLNVHIHQKSDIIKWLIHEVLKIA